LRDWGVGVVRRDAVASSGAAQLALLRLFASWQETGTTAPVLRVNGHRTLAMAPSSWSPGCGHHVDECSLGQVLDTALFAMPAPPNARHVVGTARARGCPEWPPG